MRKLPVLIGVCSLLAVLPVLGQSAEDQLERAVRIYNQQRAYLNSIKEALADSQLIRLEGFRSAAAPLLADVQARGTDTEKRTARYFNMLLNYEIAFSYGRRSANDIALKRMQVLESDMRFYGDPTVFPLRYRFDSKNYVIHYRNFGFPYAEYLAGLGELLINQKRCSEAISNLEKSYASDYSSNWIRYVSSERISNCYRQSAIRDSAKAFLWNKRALFALAALDDSSWSTIRKMKYKGVDFFAEELWKYVAANLPLELVDYPLAESAIVLEDWGDDKNLCAKLYATSVKAGNRNVQYLETAALHAERKKDAKLAAYYRSLKPTQPVVSPSAVPTPTAPARPSELKPSTANLSFEQAVQRVVQTVQGGKSSFLQLKGQASTSQRYAGTVYQTTKQMSQSLEEFIAKIDVPQSESYYWYCWLGEGPDTNLGGALLSIYQESGRKLRALFPQAVFKNLYNKFNYLEADLGNNCVVNLSYYFNSNTNKENVLMYVRASYSR